MLRLLFTHPRSHLPLPLRTPTSPPIRSYTSPRDYLFGATVVLSALKARRRKIHRLHVLPDAEDGRRRRAVEAAERYSLVFSAKESVEFEHLPNEGSEIRNGPLWVALDRIVDPQNLGAILRTCHFFGVDGVITTEQGVGMNMLTCGWVRVDRAPLTPVVSKASAGAMEVMNCFSTSNLPRFLEVS
ncbi:Ribose methyltransferase [Dinochytrium kinnereticum]|nr:Ribose methyltransferase [Dinochytrium kinnereticum]